MNYFLERHLSSRSNDNLPLQNRSLLDDKIIALMLDSFSTSIKNGFRNTTQVLEFRIGCINDDVYVPITYVVFENLDHFTLWSQESTLALFLDSLVTFFFFHNVLQGSIFLPFKELDYAIIFIFKKVQHFPPIVSIKHSPHPWFVDRNLLAFDL